MAARKKQTKLFIIGNGIVLLILLIAFGREYIGNLQIQREIYQLEQEKADLENKQLETLNLISELSSEYYLEEEGRIKQGLGKEGETLVIIKDNNDKDQEQEFVTQSELSNLKKWFYYFFAPDKFDELKKL